MKADVCGKEKIAEHTKNPAQEMHRISTGWQIHPREKKLLALQHVCACENSRGMNFAGRPRESIDSKRVVA